MLRVTLVLFFLLVATPVWALEFSAPTPTRTYEPISLGNDPITMREYYGELTGDPLLYEVVALQNFTLRTVLDQPREVVEPLPLRLLVVREIPGGRVEVVTRLEPTVADWQAYKEHALGLAWWRALVEVPDLAPGTYRIEVSSAYNVGSYRLTLGTTDVQSGYVGAWQRLWFVQSYYERSVFALLTTSFVLWQLVAVIVLALCWRYGLPWWRRRFSSSLAKLLASVR
jgi:hypothetical protein